MSLEEVFAVNNIPRCTVHGQMKTLDRMEDFAEPRKPQGNSLPPPSAQGGKGDEVSCLHSQTQ